MKLIIDIGNTSSKVAIFDGEEIIKHQILSKLTLADVILFAKKHAISASIISSVKEKDSITNELIRHFNALFLTHKIAIPIFTNYKTPETLGKDRIAAIVGTHHQYPKSNILVIDAGSCITFDFFIDGKYCGGRISPGLKMRYDALHTFTNQLPQLGISNAYFTIGNDTNSSITSGVQQGAIDEMNTVVDTFRKENKDSVVILCGGDHKFFDKHLKNSIFADPFIVLKGLNIILEFNAK
ncbi:MAG TPA: type III pantothenate kinase [Flavobacteriales bacterium]|jgi:type III pantothenate kinase|nr:type III pantothenate kinase [Flavobacteriales bacterium]HJN64276.1 type III pantothenate kinase [Flavobacteriales bacterium]|tara:strand:+ start:1446 stop:2162 length:717 start_codon:yes stop_codon:yes gene_type:complete